jgi:type IV pilus assembly protein PilC
MSTVLTYAYKGRDAGGKLVKGKVEAPSESAVVSRLRTMGLTPVEIRESVAGTGLQMELSFGSMGGKRVKTKDLAVMARQLATMIASGLSILKALSILAEQTESKPLARTLGIVRTQVETGSSLSEALQKHPEVFPPLMVHLVRAGEVGGFLDQALESVATTFEKDVKLMSTIKSAMTYPVVVLVMAIVAVIGMIVFIVPVFKNMFADLGGELPLPTQILVTLSENAYWALPLFMVVVVVFFAWWRRNKRTDAVRSRVDALKLKLPVFGPLFQKVAIARVTRNLATMTKSGVPILQALAIVADTSNNWVIEKALHEVQDSVRVGRSIAGPLAEHEVFPAMVVQMIAVGEDSGSLEQMLTKIADFYDDEVQTTTEALTSLIEPLMIAVIGVLIGGIIVSLYMPMFSLYSQISG